MCRQEGPQCGPSSFSSAYKKEPLHGLITDRITHTPICSNLTRIPLCTVFRKKTPCPPSISPAPSLLPSAPTNLRKRMPGLTGRNRLINYRHTRGSSLRIIDERPNLWPNTCSGTVRCVFLPCPNPASSN